jgi:hypothetical protein
VCDQDLHSNRIVGYSMDGRMKASLAVAELGVVGEPAQQQRQGGHGAAGRRDVGGAAKEALSVQACRSAPP